jgi:hypothetical protein
MKLTAAILDTDLVSAGTLQVTVVNPPPGGGTSKGVTFTVGNPVPKVRALSQQSATVGDKGFALTVNGSGFMPSSVVDWSGASRTTKFISATQITAAILDTDLASAATIQVAVVNPSPLGGTSNSVTFTVNNPTPTLTSLSPQTVAAGSPDLTVTVTGTSFVPSSVVNWDGAALATTFVGDTQLTATVPAKDIAGAGNPSVTVTSPEPGGGTTSALPVYVYLNLATNDLIYDPFGKKIYASVPSSAAEKGNSIMPIDPETGLTGTPVPIGSEPGKLAISDDGEFIYAALNGAAAVRRFILSSQTADIQFSLGRDPLFGPKYPGELAVAPGAPRTLAVSRRYPGVSPSYAGIAIYDDGVMRPTESNTFTGGEAITYADAPSTLYGYDNESSEFELDTFAIDSSGIVVGSSIGNLISGYGVEIKFDGGRIYATSGQVVDPVAGTLVGTLSLNGTASSPVPDDKAGRVFFLTQSFEAPETATIQAFDPNTLAQTGSLDVPGISSSPSSLVRWGTNGLAFRTNGNQVFVLTANIVPAGP